MQLSETHKTLLDKALDRSGQRSTRQREHIYGLLLEHRDHPTADEVYARARSEMPTISLATVYNCLETLSASGLIKQVNFEREPTRYCPNLTSHAHFYCKESGEIQDIELSEEILEKLKDSLPAGYTAHRIDIAFDGKCGHCHD
jgi:Fur family peroxide stress response transcriptional regulator